MCTKAPSASCITSRTRANSLAARRARPISSRAAARRSLAGQGNGRAARWITSILSAASQQLRAYANTQQTSGIADFLADMSQSSVALQRLADVTGKTSPTNLGGDLAQYAWIVAMFTSSALAGATWAGCPNLTVGSCRPAAAG